MLNENWECKKLLFACLTDKCVVTAYGGDNLQRVLPCNWPQISSKWYLCSPLQLPASNTRGTCKDLSRTVATVLSEIRILSMFI